MFYCFLLNPPICRFLPVYDSFPKRNKSHPSPRSTQSGPQFLPSGTQVVNIHQRAACGPPQNATVWVTPCFWTRSSWLSKLNLLDGCKLPAKFAGRFPTWRLMSHAHTASYRRKAIRWISNGLNTFRIGNNRAVHVRIILAFPFDSCLKWNKQLGGNSAIQFRVGTTR